MKIKYLDMWPGFDDKCNWFNLMFQGCFPNESFDFVSENPDIVFASSFGTEKYQYKNSSVIKIFYTGENERPDFSFADYSLTFDYDSYDGKNFRLPHWFLYINWWNEPNFPHARISTDRLFKAWDAEEIWNRKNFCAIIIGNPVRNRLEVAQKLNEYQTVHGFGRAFGRYYDGCKINLLEKYRWNICFENSVYPGYITEKLLEAKVAGCIPIYYGDMSVKGDFNDKGFINYLECESSDFLLSKITEINSNKNLFCSIIEQPLFNTEPNLTELYTFLKRIINE